MAEEGPDPYAVWKSQIYTFVLCWKHSAELRHTYQRDLVKTIAWLVPVDFSQGKFKEFFLRGVDFYPMINRSSEPIACLQWVKHNHFHLKAFYAPCQVCLRPCSTYIKRGNDVRLVGKCSKEAHRGLAVTCIACFMTAGGRCKECVEEVCKHKNILVSFDSLFNKGT